MAPLITGRLRRALPRFSTHAALAIVALALLLAACGKGGGAGY